MSNHSVYRQEAYDQLRIATDLLEKTYHISQDPKVLIAVLHHLKATQEACISFVGYLQGKILSVDEFLEVAKKNCAPEELAAVREVHQLCKQQKESGVEFRRKDSYVLCNEEYELSSITKEKVQPYVQQTITLTKKLLR